MFALLRRYLRRVDALYLALSGLCQMGDAVVAASGKPYDTLENAIGLSGDHPHSLKKQGVSFDYVDLNDDGSINIDGVLNMVAQKNAAVLYVQRSRGYAWRDSLLVNEHMAPLFRAVKERFPNVAIFVDNCYGEFTDVVEPLCAGADIIAGSLIKNPGGGIAPTGGYIAGKAKYIQRNGAGGGLLRGELSSVLSGAVYGAAYNSAGFEGRGVVCARI